jgi:hypothetical protein
MIKPIGTIVLASLILCTACDSYVDTMDSYTLPSEKLLLLSAAERPDCKRSPDEVEAIYETFFGELQRMRKDTVRSNDNHTFYNKPKSPFCDAVYELKTVELNLNDKKCTISYAHQSLANEDIIDMCDKFDKFAADGRLSLSNSTSTIKPNNTETPEKLFFTNAMYDNLISAVKTCKRAEYAIINEFEPEQEITKEQHDKVQKIITDCKKFQLEQALQGHDNEHSNN